MIDVVKISFPCLSNHLEQQVIEVNISIKYVSNSPWRIGRKSMFWTITVGLWETLQQVHQFYIALIALFWRMFSYDGPNRTY